MAQKEKALTSLAEAASMAFGELSLGLRASPASEAGGAPQEELIPIAISARSASSSRGGKQGKALGEAASMAFGELSLGLRPSPASEAGGAPQEELLPIAISARSASISRGEGRTGNLGRRRAELRVAADAAQAGKALSSPGDGGRSRRAVGELSPGRMAALVLESGGEPQEELLSNTSTPAASSDVEGRVGVMWQRLAELRDAACAVEAELSTMKREKEVLDQNRSDTAIAVSHIGHLEGTVLRLQNELMKLATALEEMWEMPILSDESVLQEDCIHENIHGFNELDLLTRTFKQISLKSSETHVSRELTANAKDDNYMNDIRKSEGSLKDLASRIENISSEFYAIKGDCTKYLLYNDQIHSAASLLDRNNLIKHDSKTGHLNDTWASMWRCDDESSSTRTSDSDSEDEVLNFMTETRQPNYQHMPPEDFDFALPELSSLDLSLQFASKQEMSGIASHSSSSSSSSSSPDSQTSLDDHDDIYSERHSIGIAADEEEDVLLAEASICVADDFEALELIIKHDEKEVFANLGRMHQVSTHGAQRETLLDLNIIFFAKEKNATSCAVCISEFDTIDRCIRLPCKHLFHYMCIIEWLLTKNTCPVCREPL